MKRRRMDDLDMKVLNNHRRDLRRDLHEDLHEDVIFYHILTRLPVKVLLQLRLVCKSWRRFLSSNNPSFIDRQLSRSQYGLGGIKLLILGRQRQSRCLLLINLEEGKDGRVNELLPIPNEEFNDFSISENIKGLVCLHQIVGTRSCTSIRNLSTREVMELPLAPDITTNDDDMTMTRMHMSHHFGFDPSSKQFKVLNIQFASYNCRGTAYGVAFWIFTLGCDSWQQIYPVLPFNVVGYNEPSPWLFLLKNCVCLNGALHWLFKAKKVIVVFNIKKEEFHAIPLPKISMLPDAERVVLLQVDGHLVVLSLRDDVLNHGMLDMEIWTLEDYQNKVWMKYTVTIPFQDWRKWHDRPVFVVPADKDLQLENGSQSHSHLGVLCYVAKQRSLMRVQIPELSNLGISHIYNSISYSETIHNLLF